MGSCGENLQISLHSLTTSLADGSRRLDSVHAQVQGDEAVSTCESLGVEGNVLQPKTVETAGYGHGIVLFCLDSCSMKPPYYHNAARPRQEANVLHVGGNGHRMLGAATGLDFHCPLAIATQPLNAGDDISNVVVAHLNSASAGQDGSTGEVVFHVSIDTKTS